MERIEDDPSCKDKYLVAIKEISARGKHVVTMNIIITFFTVNYDIGHK